MKYRFAAPRRRQWTLIFFAATAISIGACSNPSWDDFSPATSSQSGIGGDVKPAVGISWINWLTVNDPNSPPKANNKITGMSDGQQLVGVYYTGTGDPTSFVAATPPSGPGGYVYRNILPPPGASSMYLTGRIASGHGGEAGYVDEKKGSSCAGTCGVIHMIGWTTVADPGSGSCDNTRVMGIGAQRISVGYYVSGANCTQNTPFEEYSISVCCGNQIGSPQYVRFHPPGTYTGAVATGINGDGDVVGYALDSAGKAVGWYYSFFAYHKIAVPDAISTRPLAINWQDSVVGEYVDSNGETHAFLLQGPGKTPQTYQYPIYYKNSEQYNHTVVSTIDDCNDIAGWYTASDGGPDNGFVGTIGGEKCSTFDPFENGNERNR